MVHDLLLKQGRFVRNRPWPVEKQFNTDHMQ